MMPVPPMPAMRAEVSLGYIGGSFRFHRVVCGVGRRASEQRSCADGKDDSELVHYKALPWMYEVQSMADVQRSSRRD
jgi:hypothetical protein